MRCLTLAGELAGRGWSCRLACAAGTRAAARALENWPGEVIELPPGRETDPAALLEMPAPHWLVVDHYGLDAAYERALAAWAGRILVIDDLADRPHECDLLLDQTVGRQASDYDGRVGSATLALAGPRFALLRPGFTGADPGRELGRILVSLGGTDPADATGLALDALAKAGLGLPVDVVLGGAAPHLDSVKDRAARLVPPARVLTDVADMAGVMAACGLAVGAAGTSALERARMALPTVTVVIADNQRQVAAGLERAGAARLVALDADAIAEALADLARDDEARRRMARKACALCDGNGAARLADLMAVELRPATLADGEDLLAWRNDPLTRENSLETGQVARDGHFAWLAGVLADPQRLILVGERGEGKVGMVRFDTMGEREWRVSISVAPEARGRGLGRVLLAFAVGRIERLRGPGAMVAEIRESNAASQSIFTACGFRQSDAADGVLYFRRPPP
ncbi:hypothetical protein A6A04_05910 [Paramagnetospirillum marisnigri]|uniref:N-acetyltransferase domain-containing protein n=2 Tax=Paramagnetospirillum marisnigri TaxID=1285242 RepID=A0A178MF22_9PROT|nr:hypothetical protein A6A04_05910 [Paramagnetospirillum marisnigri]